MAFIDQGEYGAMKTLGGHRAPHSDKHHFRAKMMVSTEVVVEHSILTRHYAPFINCLTLRPLRL